MRLFCGKVNRFVGMWSEFTADSKWNKLEAFHPSSCEQIQSLMFNEFVFQYIERHIWINAKPQNDHLFSQLTSTNCIHYKDNQFKRAIKSIQKLVGVVGNFLEKRFFILTFRFWETFSLTFLLIGIYWEWKWLSRVVCIGGTNHPFFCKWHFIL